MECIDKAEVAKIAANAQKQLADTQLNMIRLQGAQSALEAVLNLPLVELDDLDEVTEEDVEQAARWLETQPLDESAEYEVEVGGYGEYSVEAAP